MQLFDLFRMKFSHEKFSLNALEQLDYKPTFCDDLKFSKALEMFSLSRLRAMTWRRGWSDILLNIITSGCLTALSLSLEYVMNLA